MLIGFRSFQFRRFQQRSFEGKSINPLRAAQMRFAPSPYGSCGAGSILTCLDSVLASASALTSMVEMAIPSSGRRVLLPPLQGASIRVYNGTVVKKYFLRREYESSD